MWICPDQGELTESWRGLHQKGFPGSDVTFVIYRHQFSSLAVYYITYGTLKITQDARGSVSPRNLDLNDLG